jgi:serine/threonine protein kinase
MANDPVSALVEALVPDGLLDCTQLREVVHSLQVRHYNPHGLAQELAARGWLTPYQADLLVQGKAAELFLGPYVLLDRLGQGGMGQVFRARHRKLHRVVAIKVILRERLAFPAIVQRFYREIQAAAQLSHPNIVHALDAGKHGDTHFFVMEYVEGTDLALLVKQRGLLAIDASCDYIRQAALGLQHAFERGLVHRDVKPDNLILTAQGSQVKLLDMGLARLQEDAAGAPPAGEGKVVGSADFIAPEQTLDSASVDIRADLYSLGGTFYFLLTGQVPFPGGTVKHKIECHRMREPKPVEVLRPEVPAVVVDVVRRLMSKWPRDRYQTPAEVAAALASPEVTSALKSVPVLGLKPRASLVGSEPGGEGNSGRRFFLLTAWGFLLLILGGLVTLLLTWASDSTSLESE